MKITLISHDLWGYGKHIEKALIEKGHDITFINCIEINYKYTSFLDRIHNFLRKTISGKNIKKEYRTEQIIKKIQNLSLQDTILVINPGEFNDQVFDFMKEKTQKLIGHNYDSLKRVPLPKDYKNIFNKTFSFDDKDVKEHTDLIHLPNFIYLDFEENKNPNNKAFVIISKSRQRELILQKIALQMESYGIHNFEFIVVTKKDLKLHRKILCFKKNLCLNTVKEKMADAEILIDLLRKDQDGLSFRVFDALALNKKLITNNINIKEYDFYNPNNIFVIENTDVFTIPKKFLEHPHEKVPQQILNNYTLNHWVDKILS